MINTPLVSVLMTVYNREEFISQAIDSVLKSTYQNWELILVDDGSTDKSLRIIRDYETHDNRIKVFQNKTNLGDYPNRNQAAAYAKGKYLKYVDADDMIYPYGLEQLVFYMEQFPEAGFGLCSLEQDLEKIFPFMLTPEQIYKRHYFEGKLVFHKAPLSSIIRKDVFKAVGGFANVRHFGDSDLWHRLSQRYPLVLMPHGIAWYRKTDGQEASVRRKNPLNRLKTIHSAYKHTVSDNSPLSRKEQEIMKVKFLKLEASAIIFGYRKFGWKKGQEMKKFSGLTYIDIIKNKLG
ncbi:glycosyltransferase family 2 protein [Formosa sediminum]|uniref:Glycosyltransferase family 2 protein n=1 Tax=Formosa sediminum TaxID=2594004 RepID=A0A516GQ84_9FLAO|nr:glycosyltransferase family A protein [Formosa sediminum]QDO93691.1 glycosyltransferase family 2 protein [Formosa sediminum]